MQRVEVVVVGAGIVGLATARAYLTRRPGAALVVLDKEPEVGAHQTGHNSGVIHSGIYYPPGSHKSQLVKQSREHLLRFCEQHAIPVDLSGKVIVATRPGELGRLHALYERGMAHGLAVRRLDRAQLREVEPHVAGLAAVHVPEAGLTDFGLVCRRLADEVGALGGELRLGTRVTGVRETVEGVVVATSRGELLADGLIGCAGLHSDLLAPQAGPDKVRIVPFRGEYYDVRAPAAGLVRSMVYPVPDPRFPFLGVHLTRSVHGGLHAGPNAVLALSREGYRWRDVDAPHVRELLGDPGLRTLARRYWRVGLAEMVRSASKRAFARAVQHLVPAITADDLVRAPSGVRAQALAADGTLLDDFAFRETPRTMHVINAPSPAATASFGLGEYLAERFLQGRPESGLRGRRER